MPDIVDGDRRVLLHHLRLDDVELAGLRRSASGATLLLYDGSPFHPTATCCSTSPTPRA